LKIIEVINIKDHVMMYEIRLSGAEQDDGKIELQRLVLLAQSLTDIAKGALQIRLIGISIERGRQSERISQALKIKLADLKKGSTILELECDPFMDTLAGQQGDVFRADILENLPTQTPMSLVIESFAEALNYKEDSNHLDKALLNKLKSFGKVFASKDEIVTISNQGSIQTLQLKKADIETIKVLEESIPEPQEIIINGVVDELKYSKLRVSIATKDGVITGVLSEDFPPENISPELQKKKQLSNKFNANRNN
jgi:hypothetical protein